MANSNDKAKKEVILGGTGKWVFTSSMDEALSNMDNVLDKVMANTAKTRASQPKRRVA